MSSVKIVAITKPLVDGLETANDFIAYAARVSNPDNQMNNETGPKLVKYLIENAHWSPLEMVQVTMEIETTRDIAHQIVRHRSFSFQEFSQRYANALKMGFVHREARLQDKKNRQNSVPCDPLEHAKLIEQWNTWQLDVIDVASSAYAWAIDNGIAKEQARVVLPEGLTKSKLYMAGTLRSWYHYCQLRSANGTQKEHMIIAQDAWEALKKEFPDICS